jgi:hypothetical protein
MTGLDIFALIVLIVLALAAVAGWVVLAIMPGRIARARNHPQAEAISVCGWWGAITLGILAPLAYIWAYTRPPGILEQKASLAEPEDEPGEEQGE